MTDLLRHQYEDGMTGTGPQFETRLAASEDDLRAAQRLRYAVFVAELGGSGPGVDHAEKLEADQFDAYAEHLLLLDRARPADDQLVGVYRLMDDRAARRAGRFYSESEFDLAPLKQSGRPLLELGRSCLRRDYRGGAAMHHLWHALAQEVLRRNAGLLFGVASFSGRNPDDVAAPLSLLHHAHRAPAALRPVARAPGAAAMDRIPAAEIDRVAALRETPALIKAYLRLGGTVGDGAFVDRDFNTIDVCLVLDVDAMSPRQQAIYSRAPRT